MAIIRLASDLRSEYSHSVSASCDYYYSFGKFQADFLLDVFNTVLNDVFTLDKIGEDALGDMIKECRNADGATIAGIGLEVKAGLPGCFELQMGYTFQCSRYDEPESWSDDVVAQKKMFRSPNHYGYLTSNVNIVKDLKVAVFGNYIGRMLVQHNAGVVKRDCEKMAPHFGMGLRLSYNVRFSSQLHFEINGGVKNIFDSYQKDIDYGVRKDVAYVYGPMKPRPILSVLNFLYDMF